MDNRKLKELIENQALKFYIDTYGCQMNAHDSEKIAGILMSLGYQRAEEKLDADFILFNTCCVRENAENKIFGNVGKLKQWKNMRPSLVIGVCGCMMQQPGAAARLSNMFPFVDIIFGTNNMDELPAMLYSALINKEHRVNICENAVSEEDLPMLRTPPPLAAVNIMQGCDNFCTYCIVPFVRGREHSRPMGSILREIETLQKEGYKEVMLLGQNVNSYGKGIPGANFPHLLEAVANTGIERVRFMTSHPKDVSLELMEQMACHENICKQLHLPIQSGSTEVLCRMNRRYTREEYLELVRKIRSIVPEIALSTDVMVGFPGETEKDFSDTYSLVEEVRFDSAFTFEYSKRKGTKAADFADQVPEDIKKERIMRLIDLQSKITYESNLAYVGKTESVLIEGISTRNKTDICGRTDSGKMVNAKGSSSFIGRFVPVDITGAKKTSLQGEIIYADTPLKD